jgi:hypothetical protein
MRILYDNNDYEDGKNDNNDNIRIHTIEKYNISSNSLLFHHINKKIMISNSDANILATINYQVAFI